LHGRKIYSGWTIYANKMSDLGKIAQVLQLMLVGFYL
jgi:hypothetical protein